MSVSALNFAWMLIVVQQAIEARDNGTNIFVGDFPEIQDLASRGYLTINKRKKDENGNWFATAPEGLTYESVQAVLQPAQLQAAPTPAVAAPATEVAPAVQAAPETLAPVAPVAPAPAATLADTAQPQFAETQTLSSKDIVIGAGLPHQVVETTQNAEGESFDIDVGVAYVKRINMDGLRNSVRAPRPEKYPFSVIANLKMATPETLANDAYVPSFHIANKESKNISGMVTRQNEKYEQAHGVTFRVQQVDATDPKGEGVRVFAMSLAQAPARKTSKKKAASGNVNAAPSPTTLVDNGAVAPATLAPQTAG